MYDNQINRTLVQNVIWVQVSLLWYAMRFNNLQRDIIGQPAYRKHFETEVITNLFAFFRAYFLCSKKAKTLLYAWMVIFILWNAKPKLKPRSASMLTELTWLFHWCSGVDQSSLHKFSRSESVGNFSDVHQWCHCYIYLLELCLYIGWLNVLHFAVPIITFSCCVRNIEPISVK